MASTYRQVSRHPLMNFTRLILALLVTPCLALAKAGPEIPLPAMPLREAVQKVETYFLNTFEKKGRSAGDDKFMRECIVTNVQYTDTFFDRRYEEQPGDQDRKLGEWCWVITIVHPRGNDHTWTFQLRRDGTIRLLESAV